MRCWIIQGQNLHLETTMKEQQKCTISTGKFLYILTEMPTEFLKDW